MHTVINKHVSRTCRRLSTASAKATAPGHDPNSVPWSSQPIKDIRPTHPNHLHLTTLILLDDMYKSLGFLSRNILKFLFTSLVYTFSLILCLHILAVRVLPSMPDITFHTNSKQLTQLMFCGSMSWVQVVWMTTVFRLNSNIFTKSVLLLVS
jgi:hypothetical protein